MSDQINDILKDLAQESPEKQAKREANARLAHNMRGCICGHNFIRHNDPALYKAWIGKDRPLEYPTACVGDIDKLCPCIEFVHITEVAEPCECGHDKRHHIVVETASGEKILKCKYESCKHRCLFFVMKETVEKDVTPEEQKALIQAKAQKKVKRREDKEKISLSKNKIQKLIRKSIAENRETNI